MIPVVTHDSFESALEREVENCSVPETFSVCDLGTLVKLLDKWRRTFPKVEVFYAVKVNDDKVMLRTLLERGTGFDCASKSEIADVLSVGTDPSKIIYSHPCKPIAHVCYARDMGVRKLVFDNLDELVKTKQYFPDAELVLRIITEDSKSAHPLSTKFGASLSSVEPLLQAAKSMNLNVIGVSFHVGSGCLDPNQYTEAIKSARFVFDKARELGLGDTFNLLDIGGGFPGTEHKVTLDELAKGVNDALETYFPIDECSINTIWGGNKIVKR